MMPDMTIKLAEACRALSDGPCVTLELTPGWCLASVVLDVTNRATKRRRRIRFGRGGRTQEEALRRLAAALRHEQGRTPR